MLLVYKYNYSWLTSTSLTGNKIAQIAEIKTVRIITLVPLDIELMSLSKMKLIIKLTNTIPNTTLSFLAAGIIIARNIPNNVTAKAETKRAGRILPAIIPKDVPNAQPGTATSNAPRL